MAKKYMQTKKITSDVTVTTAGKSGIVHAITLRSGTADGNIKVRDGGATGTIKWTISLNGTTNAGDVTSSISFDKHGIVCATDIFADIAGTGAIAYILYDEIED